MFQLVYDLSSESEENRDQRISALEKDKHLYEGITYLISFDDIDVFKESDETVEL